MNEFKNSCSTQSEKVREITDHKEGKLKIQKMLMTQEKKRS